MTVIASAGTIATATKGCTQCKLFFDGTRWWSFYMKSGTANTLFYAYSTDLSSWTETSVALGGTVVNDGGTIDVVFDAGTAVLLVAYETSDADPWQRYLRGAISGTTISWGANTASRYHLGPIAGGDHCTKLALTTGGIPMSAAQDGGGNVNGLVATNAISSTFADNAWVYDSTPPLNDVITRDWIGQLASGQHIIISDDLSGATRIIQYCVTTAGVAGSWATIYSGSATDRSTWAVAQLSTTAIYLIGISAASTLTFRSFNGTSWSTLSAPSWPTGGVKTNGITLVTDGTDVWAVAILNDSANTIAYAKYNVGGASWGAWTNLVTSTQVRNHLSPAQKVGNGLVAFLYSQTNGSNFDVTVDSFSTSGGSVASPATPHVVQVRRQRRRLRPTLPASRDLVLVKARIATTALASNLSGSGTAAAALTTGVSLAASLSGSGTLSATFATVIPLAADFTGSGTLSGALSTGIQLGSALSGSGVLGAALSTQIPFAAALTGNGTLAALLNSGTRSLPSLVMVRRRGDRAGVRRRLERHDRVAQYIAYQASSTAATLSASLTASGTLSAPLTTAIRLGGALAGIGTLSGAITTGIQLACTLTSTGSLAADLTTTQTGISAALMAAGTLSSDLLTAIPLATAFVAVGALGGSLTTRIPLGANFSAQSSILATLTALAGSQLLKGKLRVVPAWIATLGINPHV